MSFPYRITIVDVYFPSDTYYHTVLGSGTIDMIVAELLTIETSSGARIEDDILQTKVVFKDGCKM